MGPLLTYSNCCPGRPSWWHRPVPPVQKPLTPFAYSRSSPSPPLHPPPPPCCLAAVPLSRFLCTRVCVQERAHTDGRPCSEKARRMWCGPHSERTDGRTDTRLVEIDKKKFQSRARSLQPELVFFFFFLKDTCYCVSRSQFGSGRGCKSWSRRRKGRSMGLFLLTAARLPHWHKHQGAGGELSPSIQLPVSVLCPRTITVLCWPKHVLSSVEVGGKILPRCFSQQWTGLVTTFVVCLSL